MAKKFHLGWFVQYRTPIWYRGTDPWAGNVGREWQDGSFLIEAARQLERAGFDYLMLEDSSKVSDAHGGTYEADLKHGRFAPKHDPIPLVPLLAQATKHIGIVATMSTTFYPPYILARLMATLDHVTHGRVGWNVVTSSGDRAAQNFGMDQLFDHDLRYEIATEFTELVFKLWDSWEPDALVADQETGVYVDHTKVHDVNHEGRFFKVRGPLNVLPSPQRRPVISQAGASAKGMEYAARFAEAIIAPAHNVAAMKEYRRQIFDVIGTTDRDPATCKVLYLTQPVLGATMAEAQEKYEALKHPSDYLIEDALNIMSVHTEIDFSQFDLDAPLPEQLTTNGHRSTLESLYGLGNTVREIGAAWWTQNVQPEFVGTPDHVADEMGRVMEEVGGDGFLITQNLSRTYLSEIADGLAPALRERGLIRSEYPYPTFRENLFEF